MRRENKRWSCSTQCRAEIERKLMRALDTIYLHNRLCESTRRWCWKDFIVVQVLRKNVFSLCARRKDLRLFAREIRWMTVFFSVMQPCCIFMDGDVVRPGGRSVNWYISLFQTEISQQLFHWWNRWIVEYFFFYRHSWFSEDESSWFTILSWQA